MRKKVVIVVDSDPRSSHRAAEALRLAAGLSAWSGIEITVCLMGRAGLMLGKSEELAGAEDIRLALPLLQEAGAWIFAEAFPAEVDTALETTRKIDTSDLAGMAGVADYSLRF